EGTTRSGLECRLVPPQREDIRQTNSDRAPGRSGPCGFWMRLRLLAAASRPEHARLHFGGTERLHPLGLNRLPSACFEEEFSGNRNIANGPATSRIVCVCENREQFTQSLLAATSDALLWP